VDLDEGFKLVFGEPWWALPQSGRQLAQQRDIVSSPVIRSQLTAAGSMTGPSWWTGTSPRTWASSSPRWCGDADQRLTQLEGPSPSSRGGGPSGVLGWKSPTRTACGRLALRSRHGLPGIRSNTPWWLLPVV